MNEQPTSSPHHSRRRLLTATMLAGLVAFGGLVVFERTALQSPATDTSEMTAIDVEPYRYQNLSGSYLSARHASQLGQDEAALDYINTAISYDRTNGDLLTLRYRSALKAGDYDTALKVMDDLKQQPGGDVLTHPALLKAVMAFKHQDYALAQKELAALPQEGISNLFVPLLQGWATLGEKKPFTAPEIGGVLKQAGVFRPLIQYQLALLEDAAGDTEAAETIYREVAKSGVLTFQMQKALNDFYQRNGSPERRKEIAKLIEHDFGAKKNPLIGEPSDGAAEVLFGLASIMDAVGAPEDADVPLQMALTLRPDFDSALYLRGTMLEAQKEDKKAMKAFGKILEQSPLWLTAQTRIAYDHYEHKEVDAALALLADLSQKQPKQIQPIITAGDILRAELRYADAVDYYSRAIAISGEEARESWPLYYARGICFERSGQWTKAEADLLEALRLEPDQPDVLNYLGYSWLIQNRHIDRARSMIETAIAARPQDAHIVDSMGWALYHLGQYEQALDYVERAADLSPRDPTVNEHLGDVYWRLGYALQAKYQWERALFFDPQEEGQADGLRQKIASGLPAPEVQKSQMATSNGRGADAKNLEAKAGNGAVTQ